MAKGLEHIVYFDAQLGKTWDTPTCCMFINDITVRLFPMKLYHFVI